MDADASVVVKRPYHETVPTEDLQVKEREKKEFGDDKELVYPLLAV